MRPIGLTTKLFLDSGNPEDTKKALSLLGFLDGQTTNPSLVAKKLTAENVPLKLTSDGLLFEYRKIVEEISTLIPKGSVSIEVYADLHTTPDEMVKQALAMASWIPNAHIKFPTTPAGLKAGMFAIGEGLRVNMTLVFTLSQAAAVYDATKGAQNGDVFISPFIGRLDDRGENGMDLIANIKKLYGKGDGHVEILAASIRSVDHILGSIHTGADIITCPLNLYEEWVQQGMKIPDENYKYSGSGKPILYNDIDITLPFVAHDISDPSTDTGLEKFAKDWNSLLFKM